MKIVKHTKNRIDLSVEPKELYLVKGVAIAGSKTQVGVPNTKSKLKELLSYEENFSDKDIEIINSYIEENDVAELSDEMYDIADPMLRPYQNLAVNKIKREKSFGLFMEQRTGKTPTSIVATRDYNKIVICVPTGLELSGKANGEKFSNRVQDVRIVSSRLTPTKRKILYKEFKDAEKMIIICSVSTLAKDTTDKIFRASFDYLIIDEAHFLRNKTKKTRGITALRRLAKECLTLTGTPATRAAHDVIPLLMVTKGQDFTKGGLIEYFFNIMKGRFAMEIGDVKVDRTFEGLRFLDKNSMVVKAKDVMEGMPEIINEKITIPMTAKQQKAYDDMLNSYMYSNKEGLFLMENKISMMIRLLQISLDPKILEIEAKSAKIEGISEGINENPDEKTIIWSSSTSFLKQLGEKISKHKPLYITGDVPKDKRQQNVDILQDYNSGRNVMLCNITAANTGYTMDSVKTMIFANRSGDATENEQADFRFIPTSKDHEKVPRTIIDLQCENSIDVYINNVYKDKLSKTDIVNNFNLGLKDSGS